MTTKPKQQSAERVKRAFETTNSDRAHWASLALEEYRAAHDADPDTETAIKDLVSDLCHLMQQKTKLKPGSVVNVMTSALQMYRDEEQEDEP